MRTAILHDPAEAADILRAGGLVAVPSETVYGLAARFDNPTAIANIFAAKQRPADNPLIVHVVDIQCLELLGEPLPEIALRLLARFAPGPLTVTMPRRQSVSELITAGLASVAVRIPASELFQQVLGSLGVPLVAPSANRSGRPSPTTWQAARDELDGLIDAVLVGPPARVGIESTVVDCCQHPTRLLRPGAITLEQLRQLAPDIRTLDELPRGGSQPTAEQPLPGEPEAEGEPKAEEALPSPGLRHRHYAPAARVVLIERPAEAIAEGTAMYLGLQPHSQADDFFAHYCWSDVEQYAQQLFACFHQADRAGVRTIFCQRVGLEGLGRGLMDRLQRAAKR
jgi:L-threonylcarbamoyladenylate synthase